MKQKYVWIGFIAVLVLGISTFMSCDDDSHDVVRFVGKAVYSGTSDPFVDIPIKVTDGQNTHCQTTTDAGGQFTLTVRISDIDGAYYLLAGDSTCVPKRVTLGGFGRMEVDLGSIEVEGPSLPIVETKPVSAVAASSATCGGNVVNDGRMQVTARGICWSTSEEPMIEDSHTTNGTGKGEFQTKITGLERNTTYYVRAYATNAKGTAYGNQVTFATTTGLPTVTTADITNITATTAKCGGEVISDGGFTVTARGICWNTMGNPDINDSKTTNGNGNGTFTSNMTGLTPNTTYYVRAYAKNEKGTNYGEENIFKTLDGVATITIAEATNITASSATCSVTVTDAGGITLKSCGICWSTNPNPTTADNKTVASGQQLNTAYPCNMSNLEPNTTYYIRGYAITDATTAYSTPKTFTTKDGKAVISLGEISNIMALTATSSVNISNAGGATIQSCGICWSTNPNPTTADNKTVASGKQLNTAYPCNMSNLEPNTTYYVRGYAITDATTAYSTPKTFTTKDGLPVVSTSATTATSTKITSGGTISSDGGYSIIERGVCYSTTNTTPTIADVYINEGTTGTGSFSATINGVSVNTTYYVRAYAKNIIGTAYSNNVVTVTTGNGLPSVTTTVVGENVTENTAISGGQVTDEGGYSVTERGVCWSTLPYPTIADNKTSNGSGIGYYSSTITDINLSGSNTYYVRAYATNINGTVYGNQVLVRKENLDYKNLPLLNYGGCIYKIYYGFADMGYYEAVAACQNYSIAGYSDWYLPSKSEIMAIFEANGSIQETSTTPDARPRYLQFRSKQNYWADGRYSSYVTYTSTFDHYSSVYGNLYRYVYTWAWTTSSPYSSYGVIAVRKTCYNNIY